MEKVTLTKVFTKIKIENHLKNVQEYEFGWNILFGSSVK